MAKKHTYTLRLPTHLMMVLGRIASAADVTVNQVVSVIIVMRCLSDAYAARERATRTKVAAKAKRMVAKRKRARKS